MPATNSVVAVYDSHEEAERAVMALQQAGIDMKSGSPDAVYGARFILDGSGTGNYCVHGQPMLTS
jgi:hypothetical protein